MAAVASAEAVSEVAEAVSEAAVVVRKTWRTI
jgi:hypothetical protein